MTIVTIPRSRRLIIAVCAMVSISIAAVFTTLRSEAYTLVSGHTVPVTPIPAEGNCGENFDGVTPPNLPGGWTTSVTPPGLSPWQTSTIYPASPPNAAYAQGYSGTEAQLTSPEYAILPGGGSFSFQNIYETVEGSSGMVLEISINGGAYQDITAGGGSFGAGGYNGVISGTPLSGRMAWTGSSGDFINTIVNLPIGANGQSIRFRWRMATGAVKTAGVEIDSIVGIPCSAPPVTPTPTPSPTATPTSTPTPTPTPGTCGLKVLIVFADLIAPSVLQSQIQAETGIANVDLATANGSTPSLGQLQQYNIVVPMSNPFRAGTGGSFFNSVALGNNLADYVDSGGVVVQYGFSHDPTSGIGIFGRWTSGNYNPFVYGGSGNFIPFTIGSFNAAHPLMNGVTTLNSDGRNGVTLASGAVEVAKAISASGPSLVAYRPVAGGRTTVAVAGYVGFDAEHSGHWGRVVANAGKWLLNCVPTPTPTATPTATPTTTPTATPTATTTPPPVISGRITYENAATPVVSVPSVSLNAAGSPTVMAATDPSGNYSLTGFGPGPYTVTPSKPAQPFNTPNGIFSNDAALISRHVVGIQTLSATQLKAAMVGGGPGVSSFDAGLLAQYIVGIPNMINLTGQWKFTPVDRSYASVTSNQTNQDYAATLMGDVSGDWTPPAMRTYAAERSPFAWDSVMASVPDLKARAGGKLTIPLRLDNLMGKAVSSYQFTLEYDPAVIEPAEIAASLEGTMADGMSIAFYSPVPGVLNVAVYGAFPVTGEGVYVDMNFTVIGKSGSSTPLVIRDLRFNDGRSVTVLNGSVTTD